MTAKDKRPKAAPQGDRKPVHASKEGWDGVTADDLNPVSIITNSASHGGGSGGISNGGGSSC